MRSNAPAIFLSGVVETETNLDSESEEAQEQKDNSENENQQKRHTVGKTDPIWKKTNVNYNFVTLCFIKKCFMLKRSDQMFFKNLTKDWIGNGSYEKNY